MILSGVETLYTNSWLFSHPENEIPLHKTSFYILVPKPGILESSQLAEKKVTGVDQVDYNVKRSSGKRQTEENDCRKTFFFQDFQINMMPTGSYKGLSYRQEAHLFYQLTCLTLKGRNESWKIWFRKFTANIAHLKSITTNGSSFSIQWRMADEEYCWAPEGNDGFIELPLDSNETVAQFQGHLS